MPITLWFFGKSGSIGIILSPTPAPATYELWHLPRYQERAPSGRFFLLSLLLQGHISYCLPNLHSQKMPRHMRACRGIRGCFLPRSSLPRIAPLQRHLSCMTGMTPVLLAVIWGD